MQTHAVRFECVCVRVCLCVCVLVRASPPFCIHRFGRAVYFVRIRVTNDTINRTVHHIVTHITLAHGPI